MTFASLSQAQTGFMNLMDNCLSQGLHLCVRDVQASIGLQDRAYKGLVLVESNEHLLQMNQNSPWQA